MLQENHYYPFGMTIAPLSQSPENGENKYQYNGKEHHADLGLNWTDYGARWYDAQLGRWHSVDPLADEPEQFNKSPYAYGWNNPIKYNDPDGQCPLCGAAAGLVTDYGLQVAGNFLDGKGWVESFTNIDGKSLATSTISGAVGVGIIGKVKKATQLTKKGKIALEMVVDGGLNATQQAIKTGEVDLSESIIAASSGAVLRGKAQKSVHGSAAKKGQRLAKETKNAQRKSNNAIKNSNRQDKINSKRDLANAKTKELEHHKTVTNRKAAVSGAISAGAVIKTSNLLKKE